MPYGDAGISLQITQVHSVHCARNLSNSRVSCADPEYTLLVVQSTGAQIAAK